MYLQVFADKNYPMESIQTKRISTLVDFHVDSILDSAKNTCLANCMCLFKLEPVILLFISLANLGKLIADNYYISVIIFLLPQNTYHNHSFRLYHIQVLININRSAKEAFSFYVREM